MYRFTLVKLLPLILSTLLLTSCSGPDSSGGVEFSKTDNSFPYGDCRGSGYQTHSTEETGCGWPRVNVVYKPPKIGQPILRTNYYIQPRANLKNATLFHPNLSGANLSGAVLQGATLYNANLSNANLSGAQMAGAWVIPGASLTNANLTNANLSGANLSGVDLTNATLTGVKANSSTICPNGKNWGTSGNDCGF